MRVQRSPVAGFCEWNPSVAGGSPHKGPVTTGHPSEREMLKTFRGHDVMDKSKLKQCFL